ncbi:MAG: hypothetical protein FWD47_02175 [Treponema sp.]|nr:hypothetical protein [Treponema sp.]
MRQTAYLRINFKLLLISVIVCLFFFNITFTSCGIEEYYFLPQVQELPGYNLINTVNTESNINIPPIPSFYYYATGYIIFYRIYLSNHGAGSSENPNLINPTLLSDINYFQPFTDPTNNSSFIGSNTFPNRRYYELTQINAAGGNLFIRFPTNIGEYPTLSLNGSAHVNLNRSSTIVSSRPEGDRSFRNTSELNNNENATASINADVAPASGATGHAYAAMYIVTVGQNPENFNRIYSKPTFISVFKLPNDF